MSATLTAVNVDTRVCDVDMAIFPTPSATENAVVPLHGPPLSALPHPVATERPKSSFATNAVVLTVTVLVTEFEAPKLSTTVRTTG